jgi:putative transcriptional regulator
MKLRAEPGTLLAASPDMLDPHFMHTVVLIAQHTEEGAYGLVLNRFTGITVDQVFPEHPLLADLTFPVFWGGPVSLDTLQFLHRAPEAVPGGLDLGGGLYLGGDFDALASLLASETDGAAKRVRLLLGYSGWGRKQLEDELALGSWMPAPLVADLAFEEDQEATWRKALGLLGAVGQELADQPPDVSWN